MYQKTKKVHISNYNHLRHSYIFWTLKKKGFLNLKDRQSNIFGGSIVFANVTICSQ